MHAPRCRCCTPGTSAKLILTFLAARRSKHEPQRLDRLRKGPSRRRPPDDQSTASSCQGTCVSSSRPLSLRDSGRCNITEEHPPANTTNTTHRAFSVRAAGPRASPRTPCAYLPARYTPLCPKSASRPSGTGCPPFTTYRHTAVASPAAAATPNSTPLGCRGRAPALQKRVRRSQ